LPAFSWRRHGSSVRLRRDKADIRHFRGANPIVGVSERSEEALWTAAEAIVFSLEELEEEVATPWVERSLLSRPAPLVEV
jgi:hypothetical protein